MKLRDTFNELRDITRDTDRRVDILAKHVNTLSKKVTSLQSLLNKMIQSDKNNHINLPTFTGYGNDCDLIDLCNTLRKNLTDKVHKGWHANLDISDSGLLYHPFCTFNIFDDYNNYIREQIDDDNNAIWVYDINAYEKPKVFNILKRFCDIVGISFKTETQSEFNKNNG